MQVDVAGLGGDGLGSAAQLDPCRASERTCPHLRAGEEAGCRGPFSSAIHHALIIVRCTNNYRPHTEQEPAPRIKQGVNNVRPSYISRLAASSGGRGGATTATARRSDVRLCAPRFGTIARRCASSRHRRISPSGKRTRPFSPAFRPTPDQVQRDARAIRNSFDRACSRDHQGSTPMAWPPMPAAEAGRRHVLMPDPATGWTSPAT